MLAGIRDILIICAPSQIDDYKLLLQRFSKIGLRLICYSEATCWYSGRVYYRAIYWPDDVALILGDAFFWHDFKSTLDVARRENIGLPFLHITVRAVRNS